MKSKKLFSTLVLASFLATGFIQPLSAKANTINVNGILESIKKSSGNEFKMAVQNKNQKLAYFLHLDIKVLFALK